MNCARTRRLLDLYVGGDLDQRRHRAVADHLHACAECAREARRRAAVQEQLRALAAAGPDFRAEDPAYWPELKRKLKAGRAPVRRTLVWQAAPAALAAAALALALWLLWPAAQPPARIEPGTAGLSRPDTESPRGPRPDAAAVAARSRDVEPDLRIRAVPVGVQRAATGPRHAVYPMRQADRVRESQDVIEF